MACPALLYFSTLSHKGHDYRKKVTEHKMCVLIFSTTFVWNIFHSEKKWRIYYHKCTLIFVESTHYFCQILMKLEFSRQIFKKMLKYQIFMKIHPVGAELFCADSQRRDETNSRFSQFCERAYKASSFCFVRSKASELYAERHRTERERNATHLTVRFLSHPRSGDSGKNRIDHFPRWICELTLWRRNFLLNFSSPCI